MNSQHVHTNSKKWFCTKKPGLNVRFKDFWYQKNYMRQNLCIFLLPYDFFYIYDVRFKKEEKILSEWKRER